MSPIYEYIDKAGKTRTVEAATSDLAISSAPNIAPTSGVQLARGSQAPATPTSAAQETPASSLGTGASTANVGGTGNLRLALRNALNEAGRKRLESNLGAAKPLVKGATPGSFAGIVNLVRGGVQTSVEDVYKTTLETYQEELDRIKEELSFNPEQYRSAQGGIYDLKNNKWVVGPSSSAKSVGEGLVSLGGVTIKSETKQIIDGFGNINDLTSTEQRKVKNDLYALGYSDSKPPEWFTTQLQEERQQSLMPKIVQQEWNTHRNLALYGKRLSAEFISDLYDQSELEKLAKKSKVSVDVYLKNLDKTIQQYRELGFTDKQIFDMMTKK